jgi:hypothetical protein
MAVPILAREQRWECPSCDLQQVTHRADVHTEFHHCAGLAGLWAPMVAAGTRAEHRAVEREDYIGAERVQVDGNGRPVMSVVTVTDDRQDCTIYAPASVADGSAKH